MDVMNLGLDDWVTCPFDLAHRMKYSRFYNHFVECRKKHPDDRRKQCPYNFSELIEPELYEKHLSECPYQSLYINAGQFKKMQEYTAPSHLDIADDSQEPLRKKSKSNEFFDSDEEFESVSMVANGTCGRYLPQRQLPSYEPPANPVSASGSETSSVKRGIGRGAWIQRMMEQKKVAPKVSSSVSVLSDESLKSRYESDFSIDVQFAEFIEPYRNDPLKITKDFGKGRGAIFRTLLRD